MNILYYDCFAGISGDMNLAAMIDLGVEPDHLRSELSKLGLDHKFELVVTQDSRNGIHGTQVDVRLATSPDAAAKAAPEATAEADSVPNAASVNECGHVHGHDHSHQGGHHHGPHRNFADIRSLIMASDLSEAVKQTSIFIFRKVAEAEGKVHGKPVDEVHFHEVGATDSIVDIVGAAICRHSLGVDEVWASSVELGGGFVRCAHGVIPVPAPATVEILQGIPTRRGGTEHEATTPTGAAILAALVDRFTDAPLMTTTKTAYGVGHRKTEKPNLLRVHLASPVESTRKQDDAQKHGENTPAAAEDTSRARLLQCNIDDMTGEMLGHALELLMEEGAMDVHFSPIIMKKNRPATMVSLLCSEEDEARFKELLFRHTTTLGIKSFPLDKTTLERRFVKQDTPLGPVTMKQALLGGKVLREKPEFEDCRELARQSGKPLTEVYAIVARQGREKQ